MTLGFTAPVFWRVVRTTPKDQNKQAIDEAVAKLTVILTIAEKQLSSHAYLAGENFTLADIQFGHLLYRYFDIDITRPELPALLDYYRRLACRPAYKEHVMVSYEELRVS